jgi:hypothetical protein
MFNVQVLFPAVYSSASSSSRMTEPHSLGRRPDQRTRTPQASSWFRCRRSTSLLKPIRNRTSSGERRQFSVEKA